MIKRILKDIKDLQNLTKNVTIDDTNGYVIFICIEGPKDSLYEKGNWKIRIELPKEYPYKSPSVGFITKIYHPNVDFASGSICLNVLNQTWTPIYNLSHIYTTFIPQLLMYPNPDDPLNNEAATLYLKDFEDYKTRVNEYISKYCDNLEM